MKIILLAAILFSNSISFAGGRIPFLFVRPPGVYIIAPALGWDTAPFTFNGPTGYINTFTLQNTGTATTASITVTLTRVSSEIT